VRFGLAELFDQVDLVAAEAKKRIEPGALLTTLRQALERRPMSARGVALRIYSALQVGVSPPTFALRVNLPDEIHFSYQRYLLNSLRHAFAFTGSPIRLLFRKGGGKQKPRRAPTSSGKGR
jgi:GTP-binding protein